MRTFVNGVAMLLGKIEREKIANIRIYPGDVRDLFDVLPEKSIAKAFLLYPDPWPKKRHHRRRFVTPDHLWPLARVMQAACEFRVATDVEDYVRQTVSEVPNCGFDPIGDVERSWHQCWPDWLSPATNKKPARRAPTTLPELPAQWKSSSRHLKPMDPLGELRYQT